MVQNLTFVLRRRWPLLVLLPVVVTLAVAFLAPAPQRPETEFEATAYLAATPGESSAISLEQAALDIEQPATAQAAAAELSRPESAAEDLLDAISTNVDDEALVLQVRAESSDRDEPEDIARAFAVAYSSEVNGDVVEDRFTETARVQEVLDVAEEELRAFNTANPALPPDVPADVQVETERQGLQDAVTTARSELTRLQSLPEPDATLRLVGVDPAERVPEPKLQLPANRGARVGLAFLMSVIGAVAIAAFLERFNPRIDDAHDAEAIVGAPVLAAVPIVSRRHRKKLDRARLEEFNGPFAEAFRSMRSHLDFLTAHEGREVEPRVMMVSAAPAEGKSTSSAFLALAYLETGRDVLVVGADLRRPTMHRLFDVPRVPGLSSRLLHGPAAPDLPDLVVRDPETGALVVASGPSTSRVTGLLNDLNLLAEAAQQAGRAVIVDSPPIVVANDAVDFLPCVDWVVVVVRAGVTSARSVKAAMQQLELNDAKVIGCVMVGSLESSDAKRYYYGYYDTSDTISDQLAREARPNGSTADGPPPEAIRPEPAGHEAH